MEGVTFKIVVKLHYTKHWNQIPKHTTNNIHTHLTRNHVILKIDIRQILLRYQVIYADSWSNNYKIEQQIHPKNSKISLFSSLIIETVKWASEMK